MGYWKLGGFMTESLIKKSLFMRLKIGICFTLQLLIGTQLFSQILTNSNLPLTSTLTETDKLRLKVGLRTVELRNRLVDLEKKTGMNFYLPDWVKGKVKIKQK